MASDDAETWRPEFKPEWVEWYDHSSFSDSRWRDMEEWEQLGPIRIVSLGFIVREDDQMIVIVPHYGDNDKGGGEMCILKADIILRRPLETE